MNESSLLKGIASGNQTAFRQLYQLYSDKVYNTVLSYTQNVEDAEEILQDVFISIFDTAAKFQYNSTINTWIYRIAVNKSLDFLRKKNSAKRKGIFLSLYKKDSQEIKYDSTDFIHPGVRLENQENAATLFKVIKKLPDNQKTAFILTHIEDLSQQETADVMKITRKAVESLIQRAKANLKKDLEKYFPERGTQQLNTSKETWTTGKRT
ncbi:RNA polymerase sigma factor [Reichenbachiella agarivorans]|uniref:RNA polymerase sigma factor n=1 Tax=Reichenbachiella agarivorans TaxID=2979464 RepID=A0ABY6CL83_9BACT|nr:RNA polymerase sigma factor [Reichenbachiella agarivorans]UXP31242.1 RNA polymerase sigma factor [Reichenbachiella agarivorans]